MPTWRKSSIFFGRIVGVVFMRMNSKCADHRLSSGMCGDSVNGRLDPRACSIGGLLRVNQSKRSVERLSGRDRHVWLNTHPLPSLAGSRINRAADRHEHLKTVR